MKTIMHWQPCLCHNLCLCNDVWVVEAKKLELWFKDLNHSLSYIRLHLSFELDQLVVEAQCIRAYVLDINVLKSDQDSWISKPQSWLARVHTYIGCFIHCWGIMTDLHN